MEKAAFRFLGYRFPKIALDFSDINPNEEMTINISTSGKFVPQKGQYELKFVFTVTNAHRREEIIKIECLGKFRFTDKLAFSEIPQYFYPNSIAIVFPYVRAFVSSVSVQAGIPPIVLPTYNLSALQEELKKNTLVEEENG